MSLTTYDTIIIGAGAAGLAAAQYLIEHGIANILVLDGQDYVGGRIKTWHDWGSPIELGAEFIHGNHTATWRYVAELGLSVTPSDGELRLIGPEGVGVTKRQKQEFVLLMEFLEKHGKKGVSVAKQIEGSKVDPLVKRLAIVSVGDYEAGDSDQLDSRAFADMSQFTKDNGDNYLLKGGYQPIVGRLSEGVPIWLGAVVKDVDLTPSYGVAVTLASGEVLLAKKCIVTVSIGVLKNGDISFSPSLPSDIQETIGKVGMGNAMKLILRFHRPKVVRELVADVNGESAMLATLTNWWASAADSQVLVGYCGGSRAEAALAMLTSDLVAKVAMDLSAIAGRDVQGDIKDYKIVRWDDKSLH